MIQFENTYSQLPNDFYIKTLPTAAVQPKMISFNEDLAQFLGLKQGGLSEKYLLSTFSGQSLPASSTPIALAYAGHQFGHFNPQLGDGRALLIGEVVSPENGQRYDLQLKGSGPTFFSRGGDGFSSLGPVLREFLVSEAMHALGVPTTRSLAAVESGAKVFREASLPGAILTRVASSHIRVGTFEFFAHRGHIEHIKTLADYVITRHDPHLQNENDKYNLMFINIAKRKLKLVAQWMGLGFIHGVMNTDNTSISGETIDYGPCAFMDEFKSNKVFSSIDRHERYAYSQQASIAVLNLDYLANTLFPLLQRKQESEKDCVQRLQNQFEDFKTYYESQYLSVMTKKLGIFEQKNEDTSLIKNFLRLLESKELDFTNSFRGLSQQKFINEDFQQTWQKRLDEQPQTWEQSIELMNKNNPYIIPRNHQIEKAIQMGLVGDYSHFHRLNQALATPYLTAKESFDLTEPPQPNEVVQKTFCGT